MYFSFVFTSSNSVESIRYHVCGVYVWCGGRLYLVPSFVSWATISLHVMPTCALTFYIIMLCLVLGIW